MIDISGAVGETAKDIEASKFRLDNLVTDGVVTRIDDYPSAGYTTFQLTRDIEINVEPKGGSTATDSGDGKNYMWYNYIYLKEGYIFDGMGNSIIVNQDLPAGFSGTTSSNLGQGGLFRVWNFIDENSYNNYNTWNSWKTWDPTTAKRNEIKNLGIHGTAPVFGEHNTPGFTGTASDWHTKVAMGSKLGHN